MEKGISLDQVDNFEEKKCIKDDKLLSKGKGNLFEYLPVTIIVLTTDGKTQTMNQRAKDLLPDIHQKQFTSILDLSQHQRFKEFISDVNGTKTLRIATLKIGFRDGTYKYVRIQAIHKDNYIYMVLFNVENYRKDEDKINYLIYHDPLTGLFNRRKLEERLEDTLREHERSHHKFALLYMDIDNFKLINDQRGHSSGDFLLTEVGIRLKKMTRKSEVVARMGGDEFCILMPWCDGEKEVVNFAKRLIRIMDEPFKIGDESYKISVSIGISIYPLDSKKAEELLVYADMAMYMSKKQVDSFYTFSNKNIRCNITRMFNEIDHLKKAVNEKKLTYGMEAIIDQDHKKLMGREILVKWEDASLGRMDTSYFMGLAEKNHLLNPILQWLFVDVFSNVTLRRAMKEEGFFLTFNLSVFQLLQNGLIERLLEGMKQMHVEAKQIKIELTEKSVVENLPRSLDAISKLQRAGVEVILDDFGLGLTELVKIEKLHPQYIKIDWNKLKQDQSQEDAQKAAEILLKIAGDLTENIIIEGIEKEKDLLFFKERGCHYFQGHYLDKDLYTKCL